MIVDVCVDLGFDTLALGAADVVLDVEGAGRQEMSVWMLFQRIS